MATERQLRARMHQLEAELARQEQESRRIQQQIAEQTQAQIRRMQAQTQEVYQRKLDETSEAYARRIREFQETLMRQNSRQIELLQREADEIRRETRKILEDMEACNKELLEELRKLRDQAGRQDAEFSQMARDARMQAENARNLVAQTPHDFFFPQEFDIISSQIQEIANLIEVGMYQAAVSDAGCIELEFKLLRTKVEQAFAEWRQAFEDYRAILARLYGGLKTFEARQHETSAGTFCMNPRELDFWSCGSYGEMAEKITTAYDSFCRMDQEQILQYLHSCAGTNRQAIYDLLTQGKKWEDQLLAVMNCVVSERLFSDQRFVIAQDVADALEELNYEVDVNQFAPADAQKAEQSWYIALADEDPQSSFDLHMVMGDRNYVKMHFVPRREHGLAVANLCYLSVDLSSDVNAGTEELVAQEAMQYLMQVLQARKANIQTEYVPSAKEPAAYIRKQEQIVSPAPSASKQMRYLERKYQ